MRNTSKIKRVLALCLIFLLSINSFAAIVSDNDGSAFVTKAEFDALKKSFAKQIDDYNSSIDGKIDGQIASYLAGMSIVNTQVIDTSTSILKYPITLWADDTNAPEHLDLATFTATSDNDPATNKFWWKPMYNFWAIWGQGRYLQETFLWSGTNASGTNAITNKIKNFYNLTNLDTTAGTAVIGGVLKNATLINNFSGFLFNSDYFWYDSRYGSFIARFDQTEIIDLYQYTTNPFTWNYIQGQGKYLYDSMSDVDFEMIGYLEIGETAFSNNTWSNNYETLTNFAELWSGNNDVYGYLNAARLKDWRQWTHTFNYQEENEIHTLFTGYNKNILIPVAYDKKIYYTNYKPFKDGGKNKYSCVRYYENAKAPMHEKLDSVIDNGFTVEPEGFTGIDSSITTPHPWYNRSVINVSHLLYNVQLPVSGVSVKVNMHDGILLTDIPKEDIAYTDLFIDMDNDSGSKKRYLIVSKNPIKDYNPTSLTDSSNYFMLYDSNVFSGGTKLFELQNGINRVFFNEKIKEKDKLYYKIIWDPSDKTKTTIQSEPVVTIYLNK